MLADLWPTFALRIRTPRLCLRLPDDRQLAALAELAGGGVHRPGERRDDEVPIGKVTLRARSFRVVREVTTSSWLGLAHHGQGYGTEARAGLLTLAFDHLGATDATTEVFPDNHGSQGVSRKLGYRPDGISRDARGEEVLVSDRLRLTARAWAAIDRPPVEVEGLDWAREMFLGQPVRSGEAG